MELLTSVGLSEVGVQGMGARPASGLVVEDGVEVVEGIVKVVGHCRSGLQRPTVRPATSSGKLRGVGQRMAAGWCEAEARWFRPSAPRRA